MLLSLQQSAGSSLGASLTGETTSGFTSLPSVLTSPFSFYYSAINSLATCSVCYWAFSNSSSSFSPCCVIALSRIAKNRFKSMKLPMTNMNENRSAGNAILFYWAMTSIIIWFQFSPVKMINIETIAIPVDPNPYLDSSPSSVVKGSEKNYFVNKANINK